MSPQDPIRWFAIFEKGCGYALDYYPKPKCWSCCFGFRTSGSRIFGGDPVQVPERLLRAIEKEVD